MIVGEVTKLGGVGIFEEWPFSGGGNTTFTHDKLKPVSNYGSISETKILSKNTFKKVDF